MLWLCPNLNKAVIGATCLSGGHVQWELTRTTKVYLSVLLWWSKQEFFISFTIKKQIHVRGVNLMFLLHQCSMDLKLRRCLPYFNLSVLEHNQDNMTSETDETFLLSMLMQKEDSRGNIGLWHTKYINQPHSHISTIAPFKTKLTLSLPESIIET